MILDEPAEFAQTPKWQKSLKSSREVVDWNKRGAEELL